MRIAAAGEHTMTSEDPRANDGRSGTPARSCRTYDLAERTSQFGEAVILFVRTVRLDVVTSPLVSQLVRSATSIGANYCEADESGSAKEFRYRISVCSRETRETKHWLRMMAIASPTGKDDARRLWKEATELNLIFASIFRKTKKGP
jgi:four helix bundle protein